MIVWQESLGGSSEMGVGLHSDEAMKKLPWSQFSLVVEWESQAPAGPVSACVKHSTCQNIRVLSLRTDMGE